MARDVSPPPPSERHLSIADSVVSTTAEEIRERYRLSVHEDRPLARPVPFRRDSIFSANTQWTADDFSISDFPRPPVTTPAFGPAIPSSAGHVPPSSWRESSREPDSYIQSLGYTHSPLFVHPSAYSSSTHLPPNSRPGTGTNSTRPGTALTVQVDRAPSRIEIVTGPSPTSPAFEPSVRAHSIQRPANLSPKSAQPATRVSSTVPSPSSQYLVPSPSTLAYRHQQSPTDTATGTFTHNRPSPTSEKVPGFPVVPPSPATAAYLREPVVPPSSHTSHEGLLEPGFIRSLMRGIEQDGPQSPFEDQFASTEYTRDSLQSYPRDSIASSAYPRDSYRQHPYEYSVEDLRPDDLEPLEPPRGFFRRAPAASLPSSPRSSFSMSVRSGVTGRGGYGQDDIPEVPKIPDAFRLPSSKRRSVISTTTGVTGTGTMTEETGIVQHAVIVRTASQRQPAVYRTTEQVRSGALSPVSPASVAPASPIPYAGTRDLGFSHARTTSRDLSLGGDVVRRKTQLATLAIPTARPRERNVVVEEEGDDLVYVRGEDVQRESRYRESHARESQYVQDHARQSQYVRESRYDMRGSRCDDSYLDSPYMSHWADLASPNEITPALRDSMINDTASYMRPRQAGPSSPGALLTPGGSSPGTPFRPPFSSAPSSAPATPGHDPPRHAKRASGISFVSSVFSKFSGNASAGHNSNSKGFQFAWRNEPVPPMPVMVRNQDGSLNPGVPGKESTLELPQLAQRAERLTELLELGNLPHRSKSTLSTNTPGRIADVPIGVDQEGNDISGEGFTDEKALRRGRSLRSVLTSWSDRSRRFIPGGAGSGSLRSSLVDIPGQQHQRFNKLPEEHRQERKVQWGEGTGVPPPRPVRSRQLPKKKLYALTAIAVLAIVAIIGVSVGLTRGHHVPDAAGYTCAQTDRTGELCDLDATCACTSQLAQCNPLAQALVDLVEPVNRLFDPSPAFTPSSVALSLWEIQGSPLPGANCANQADLIDVGPALSHTEQGSISANRTEFARSALLWTLVMSTDLNTTANMQRFVKQLDFTKLDTGSDSVLGEFLFGITGYQVDFARMTVSQPALTWQGSGKPSADQVALVGPDARKALDRVYTFASASSLQRSSALARYWTNTLQFSPAQLSEFRDIASASPVLLPFNASSPAIRTLFANVNASFPPPAACYPSLSADKLDALNAMETAVFGLPKLGSAPSALDASCFPSRPVYGVLDLPRLRSSFGPGHDAPNQAVQVSANATSRLTVRLGRNAAGLPSMSLSTANLTGSSDPRTFGTTSNMDHVLLTYLQAFPSIQAAAALVDHVLASSDSRAPPPSNTSALYNLTSGLAELPILEVAFFGTVGPSDLAFAHADLATPSGQLFFGSNPANTFRNWAIQRTDQVVWSDGPTALQVVREGKLKDPTFEEVWNGASVLLSNAETTGGQTSRADVARIANAFTTIGYMGS
ncbi:unnamed protein product [Rhizoctonia solani]|uniref:Uncharacterized protein n=1 Tax=Rhizoctonia solani TaxID=456999 RepID=A0A8H2XXZ4_9AGAM|nr:unnamed protein product [Rhizoctonia solani]